MKKLLNCIIFFTICNAYCKAQGKRILDNYKHTSKVIINNNNVKIIVDNNESNFTANLKNNLLEVNTTDEKKILQHLDFNNAQLESLQKQYDTFNNGVYKNLSVVNKIINRAKNLSGITFINNIDSTQNISDEMVLPVNNTEEFIEAKPKDKNWINILTKIAALISAIVIGFMLGRSTKAHNNNLVDDVAEESPETIIDKAVKPVKQKITVAQLQQSKKELVAKNKEIILLNKQLIAEKENLQLALQNFEAGKNRTYNAIQNKIVAPYIAATDANESAQIIASALSGMALITSMSRSHKGIKQEYDLCNLDILLEESKAKTNASIIIDSNTNADAIPKNIKTILQLLQHNNIKGIPNSSFFGYTLKQV